MSDPIERAVHKAISPWYMSIATAMGSQEHYNEFLATVAHAIPGDYYEGLEEGIKIGRNEAASMADREGHAWSGAAATSFFQLAERIRAGVPERSSSDPEEQS